MNLKKISSIHQQTILQNPILVFLYLKILKNVMNHYSNQFGTKLMVWVEAGLIKISRYAQITDQNGVTQILWLLKPEKLQYYHQNLVINWDGDEYPLGDVAEIVVSGNKVAVSVAGMSDLVSPILVTCRTHNLVASEKNDMITIKLPPVTTAIKKKSIKDANESFKKFKANFDNLLNQELKKIVSNALKEDELDGFSTHTDIIEWIVQFQVMMMTHHEDTIVRADNLLKQREKSMLK